ncbi:MAG: RHS repeat-associated core domain-containing protein [Hyphomicrobium sp.]
MEWLPWGGVHAITGSETLNARFPGQWFQVESGLHYNWHRHYDPTIGRYTQPDPLGFVDGPSVFAYARNNPQRYVDNSGRNTTSSNPPSSSTPDQCKPDCDELVRRAERLYDEISQKRIPQYLYACRHGGDIVGLDNHYTTILQKITALQNQVRAIDALCGPGQVPMKWRRLDLLPGIPSS